MVHLRYIAVIFTLVLAGVHGEFRTLMAQEAKEFTNSLEMEFVLIPKGNFSMGRPVGSELHEIDDGPHQVTISKDYYLGVHEVTQGQYQKVMGINPSYFQEGIDGNEDSLMCPVENVSWFDAVELCKRLSELPEEKKEGRVYRLPTEAEWEYACRAGSTEAFSFGSNPEFLGDYGWYRANQRGRPQPVGKKMMNAWGLYDMHGNVEEWCSDWYAYYPSEPVTDPKGPKEGSFRIMRGGGWWAEPWECRSGSRQAGNPIAKYRKAVGFRLALSLSLDLSPFSSEHQTDATSLPNTDSRTNPSSMRWLISLLVIGVIVFAVFMCGVIQPTVQRWTKQYKAVGSRNESSSGNDPTPPVC